MFQEFKFEKPLRAEYTASLVGDIDLPIELEFVPSLRKFILHYPETYATFRLRITGHLYDQNGNLLNTADFVFNVTFLDSKNIRKCPD